MLNNRKKIIFAFVVVFLLSTFYFLLSASAEAAEPLQLQIKFPCPDFPGAPCPATPEKAAESPAAYIARFYQFALAIAGMLAFGMIIFGAIQYTVSAGNVAQQSDARDRIYQALWGVALLLGAYLILFTIDPKLVSLTDPKIDIIKTPTYQEEAKATQEKYTGKEGGICKNGECDPGLECVGNRCLGPRAAAETKEEQKKHGWVLRNSCPKIAFSITYCSDPSPGPDYVCCVLK
mgnify:CR=1 FL=1